MKLWKIEATMASTRPDPTDPRKTKRVERKLKPFYILAETEGDAHAQAIMTVDPFNITDGGLACWPSEVQPHDPIYAFVADALKQT